MNKRTKQALGGTQATCESKSKTRTMNKGTKQTLGGAQATCESKSKARTMNKRTKQACKRSSDMREQEQGKV